jgi:hypothetical protein
MKKFSQLLISGACLIFAGSALATTVIPPSFDELVSRAELIFQGSVTDVRSEWTGEGAQRHIMSYVTLKVEDASRAILVRRSLCVCSAVLSVVRQWK